MLAATHELHPPRLVGNRRIPADHTDPRPLLPPPLRQKRRRLLSLRTQRELVARRHLDGRHHLRRRHSPRSDGPRLFAGHRRKLALVVVPALRHDDRLSLRPPVAPFGTAHRRAICRNALCRQAGRFPARLPRHLPRPTDELPDPGLGHQSNDHDRRDHSRPHATAPRRPRIPRSAALAARWLCLRLRLS